MNLLLRSHSPSIVAFTFAFAFALGSCQTPSPSAPDSPARDLWAEADTSLRAELFVDPHSFALPETKVSHLQWDAEVDFQREVIRATAQWTVPPGGDTLVLDTKALLIHSVSVDGEPVNWSMGEEDELLGTPLYVPLQSGFEHLVSIQYETTEGAQALQWFPAELTQGKRSPFLFTQSQAILARTWIPCQDSPGVRFSYTARVQVPKECLALMSAMNPTQKSENGVYTFEMPQKIPSYLMALGVGDLEFISLGERSGVYAEPEMVHNAGFEFTLTERMIEQAEQLYGPYRWGRYDLLVLPPSFPFGGMENPRLTFVTPTVIVGDQSLTSLIAHELAHSWSGNLVTNHTWNDFWLNEGFTVYFEMRIMERVYGKDFADMLKALSYDDLAAELHDLLEAHPEATRLKLDTKGQNPDDAVNAIAYDKGFHFLWLCEQTVGRERWDAFLKNYFEANAFGTMVTEGFLRELSNLLTQEEWDKIGVEQWVYGQGLPLNCPVAVSNRFSLVDEGIALLLAADPKLAGQPYESRAAAYMPQDITKKWFPQEWLRYIRGVAAANPDEGHFALMDEAYGLTTSNNPEVIAAWYTAILRTGYEGYDPIAYKQKVESFLSSVGRRKFIVPMYKSMLEGDEKRKAWAREIYANARANYHPLAQESLDMLFEKAE